MSRWPTGSKKLAGIVFPGNGSREKLPSASRRVVVGLKTGVAPKRPSFMSRVGTVEVRVVSCDTWVRSNAANHQARLRTAGPPSEPPN